MSSSRSGQRLERSRRSPQQPRPRPDRGWRWAAGLTTFAVAVAATVWAYELADPANNDWGDAPSFWYAAREQLRDDGYGIVVFCLVIVLVGGLLQAAVAARARSGVDRDDIGKGLVVVVGLTVFVLVLAGLATLIAGEAPTLRPGTGRRDPGGLYGAALVCLLGGPAILVIVGGVFVPRGTDFPLGNRLAFVGLISGLIGLSALILTSIAIGARTPAVRAWFPPGSDTFLYFGGIAASVLLVLTVAVALSGWLKRGLPAAAMRQQGAGALGLAAVTGYFVVTALLGAQLARILPGWLVTLIAIAWLLGSGPTMAWFFARRARPR